MIANVRTAKARLSELLERAAAGEEIVITSAGRPKAKLIGVDASPPPPLRATRAPARGRPPGGRFSFAKSATRATERSPVYLDTAILVKLVVREPDSDFYTAL